MIENALNKGEWVIMDRYVPSHASYSQQEGFPFNSSLDLLLGNEENNKSEALMPRADLVIWLDGDAEGVLRRVLKRERFDQAQFQEQVRQGLEQCMRVDNKNGSKLKGVIFLTSTWCTTKSWKHSNRHSISYKTDSSFESFSIRKNSLH